VVDAITPASDDALAVRVADAIGLEDRAAVQREPFARWAIEDDFAGPRPLWERAGVEIMSSIQGLETLKLHGLNAAHSALAYLGPPRGHALVREAIGDPELAGFLDAMMSEEVAPVFPDLDLAGYWRGTRARLGEGSVDHRLDQIAQDGGAKLRERIHPLIVANARAGRASHRLGAVVRAWATAESRPLAATLDDPTLFADPFRTEPAVRAAVLRDAT
jgi:fructuronate reductase